MLKTKYITNNLKFQYFKNKLVDISSYDIIFNITVIDEYNILVDNGLSLYQFNLKRNTKKRILLNEQLKFILEYNFKSYVFTTNNVYQKSLNDLIHVKSIKSFSYSFVYNEHIVLFNSKDK